MKTWEISIKVENNENAVKYLKSLLNSFERANELNLPLEKVIMGDRHDKNKLICTLINNNEHENNTI